MLIDIHTHTQKDDTDITILSLTDPAQASDSCFSAGLHPEYAEQFKAEGFIPLWNDPHCIAIGECGLDRRFQKTTDLKRQKDLFLQQAEVAEEKQLPLIIHSVRTHEEIRQLKSAMSPAVPWVLHGFRSNERTTFTLLDAGFYLSFGDGLLKDAGNMEPFFARIPLDRIFFETDTSTTSLRQIYALAASMRSMTQNELEQAVHANFERIFTRYGKS